MSRMLTVRETAAALRISRATVYRLLQQKRLPGVRVGGQYRISADALDQWLVGTPQ